jgi:hypothetical protein
MNRYSSLFLLVFLFAAALPGQTDRRWSAERINNWYAKQDWMVGANFNPSTAINQLEFWQAETFDPKTIDRELGYAAGIGMNTMRVYLHSLVYSADPAGFKDRLNQYLTIADRNGIKTILVFFDDVWNKEPKLGKQPVPVPGTHNSGWMQDPGDPASSNPDNFPALEAYVKDVMTTLANDDRVLFWDLYNEPGNSGKLTTSMPLLKAVFGWAREVDPSQPITVGLWRWDFKELNEYQVLHSDLINYHCYDGPQDHERIIELLQTHGRPLVCTEYMARTRNSRFSNTLPLLKKHNIGAINWGLVNGKSNTIYQWDTPIADGREPDEWFHDVFRKDGTPYRQDEAELIRRLTLEK